ncbi:HAMP domain-containing histidine kinase [Bacillus sp. FJAT-29790]|uniref:HAMP domain-containing histidine kinase n=1 Tax=Bacillus sp. FJAT-29790 TaxID=1895002 RepID=UPI001C24CC32|nr:HAMP domain-containing histidine kinase [Bacillus sp. FJAT-29790]MBU8880686.1 HAMP domain-containing histidine kinase [Bacillus sp. FJAT-29790]
MLNNLSVKWKMTIFSAVFIFFIFIICNIIQLILIHTFTLKQEEELLYKRAKEVQTYISEQLKLKEQNLSGTEIFFDKIIEKHEMIRIVDEAGNELYDISEDFPDIQKEMLQQPNRIVRTKVEGEDLLLLKEPLKLESFSGTLEIGKNVETFDTFIEKVFWVLMLGTLLSLVLSLVSGLILARKLLSPIRILANTMRKIDDQQFQERVPVLETKDEFSQLSSIFNSMMDKVEGSILKQRRFIEDASHELRTPLAVIHGHLSLLIRWGKDNKEILERSLNISIKETNRMIELTNELLQLSQLEQKENEISHPNPCYALETIEDVLCNYKLIHRDLIIVCQNQSGTDILLSIPPVQLKQILINIIDNAIKYSGDQKEITLNMSDENGKCKIEISDNGYGISEEDLPYIFDRFYRVDKARSRSKGGNGLGLSIVKNMVEENNGEIKVKSILGEGTAVILLLPYAL